MNDRNDKADVQETLEYAQARHQRMVRELAAQDTRIAALEAEVAALNRVIAGQGAEIVKLRQERADMEARPARPADGGDT